MRVLTQREGRDGSLDIVVAARIVARVVLTVAGYECRNLAAGHRRVFAERSSAVAAAQRIGRMLAAGERA